MTFQPEFAKSGFYEVRLAYVPYENRADKVAVFTAASETFARKNINASIAESIERFRPVVQQAPTLPLQVPSPAWRVPEPWRTALSV